MTDKKFDRPKDPPRKLAHRICELCNGSGDSAYSWYDQDAVCRRCNGRGWIRND